MNQRDLDSMFGFCEPPILKTSRKTPEQYRESAKQYLSRAYIRQLRAYQDIGFPLFTVPR